MKGIELFNHGINSKEIVFPSIANDFIECKPILYIEFLKLVFNENSDRIYFNVPQVEDKENLKPLEIVYHGNIEKREFLTLESFFAPSEVKIYKDQNESKFLAIASSEDTGRGGLLVGVEPNNCDMIFKYRWEESDLHPDIPLKLSNNIFEFISELETLPMWEKEYDRSKLVKLFNNNYYELKH